MAKEFGQGTKNHRMVQRYAVPVQHHDWQCAGDGNGAANRVGVGKWCPNSSSTPLQQQPPPPPPLPMTIFNRPQVFGGGFQQRLFWNQPQSFWASPAVGMPAPFWPFNQHVPPVPQTPQNQAPMDAQPSQGYSKRMRNGD
uniref:Uncharacterized protein n=1 Tax=Caenorhabditis japonica TaxID=281687 RepID=A0A8R1DQD4_CAEJA